MLTVVVVLPMLSLLEVFTATRGVESESSDLRFHWRARGGGFGFGFLGVRVFEGKRREWG